MQIRLSKDCIYIDSLPKLAIKGLAVTTWFTSLEQGKMCNIVLCRKILLKILDNIHCRYFGFDNLQLAFLDYSISVRNSHNAISGNLWIRSHLHALKTFLDRIS